MSAVKPEAPERLDVSLNTPAGRVTTPIEVPAGFVPVTAIVPLLRRLGEQAQALEERRALAAGHSISCKKGCAACCRMLVPVSAPEAFALRELALGLPEERRRAMRKKVENARRRLAEAGLLDTLLKIAETGRQLSDDEMEPVNRAYYALRMPCPFLENEVCSIYEDRPAACREMLVTSPAELCQDIAKNPVQALPVPVRMSTVLGMLWAELAGGPIRLIPLPVALDWAEHHAADGRRRWQGLDLIEKALDKIWLFLSQGLGLRRGGADSPQPSPQPPA